MLPLILIRHGQASHHVDGTTGGWTDSTLTELGHRQVALLAERLQRQLHDVPLRLISSDLRRTRQTTQPLAEALNVTPEFTPALREFNNGRAAGISREEAEQLRAPLEGNPLDWRPYPESETWREFYHRIAEYLEELIAKQERPFLLVSHIGTINNIILWWMKVNVDLQRPWLVFEVSPASLSILRYNHHAEPMLSRLNDTAHLYTEELAPPLHT
jgi:probable phosphoglycerate mutase